MMRPTIMLKLIIKNLPIEVYTPNIYREQYIK